MYPFAQNYPQLMNQASDAGFSKEQLIGLRQAFECAQLMSHGIYRSQGVPLISHLASTASMVMAEKQRAELVNVALLHAAYVVHRFTDSTQSHDLAKRRQQIQDRFGQDIDQLLWDYCHMAWYRNEAVKNYLDNIAELDGNTRDLLLVRLANELDDHLDGAMHYVSPAREVRQTTEFLALCRDLAEGLRLPVIGAELDREISRNDLSFAEIRWQRPEGYQLKSGLWQMSKREQLSRKLRHLARRIVGSIGR